MNVPEDQLEQFEAKETKHHLPIAFLVLFFGLIAWGLYYLVAMKGWTQGAALDAPDTSSGLNLFATILFTALPTLAAIVILLQRRNAAPQPTAPRSTRSRGEGGDQRDHA